MKKILVFLVLLALFLTSCTTPTAVPIARTHLEPTSAPQAGMANPASENCVAKGGTLEFETRGDMARLGFATSKITGSAKSGR